MKRFLLPRPPDQGGIIRLTGGDFHYLVRVRRLRPGAVFPALLPAGAEVRVLVQSVEGDCLLGECLGDGGPADRAAAVSPEGLPPLALFQALPRGAKMDQIVRQAAEGAVSEILPFEAEYSTPRLRGEEEGEAAAGRITRWRRIIREARQQSGSLVPTAISPPQTFEGMLEYWEGLKKTYPGAVGLLLHQTPLEQGSFHGYLNPVPPFAALAVGPEGGFSPAEAERFRAAGFRPLVMGHSILRVETAALYGMAAIRIILLENTSWLLKVSPEKNGSTF